MHTHPHAHTPIPGLSARASHVSPYTHTHTHTHTHARTHTHTHTHAHTHTHTHIHTHQSPGGQPGPPTSTPTHTHTHAHTHMRAHTQGKTHQELLSRPSLPCSSEGSEVQPPPAAAAPSSTVLSLAPSTTATKTPSHLAFTRLFHLAERAFSALNPLPSLLVPGSSDSSFSSWLQSLISRKPSLTSPAGSKATPSVPATLGALGAPSTPSHGCHFAFARGDGLISLHLWPGQLHRGEDPSRLGPLFLPPCQEDMLKTLLLPS